MLLRLTAALLPLVVLATACTTVVSVRDQPGAFIEAHDPGVVWVTKADNSIVQVASPRIIGDTIVGFVGADYVELPLSSVQSLRARQPARKRTALLIGGAALVAAGAAVAWLSSSAHSTQTTVCTDPEPERC